MNYSSCKIAPGNLWVRRPKTNGYLEDILFDAHEALIFLNAKVHGVLKAQFLDF